MDTTEQLKQKIEDLELRNDRLQKDIIEGDERNNQLHIDYEKVVAERDTLRLQNFALNQVIEIDEKETERLKVERDLFKRGYEGRENAKKMWFKKAEERGNQIEKLKRENEKLAKVAVLADKLLDVNEFPDYPAAYGEVMDALYEAVRAIGDERLAEMKYGKVETKI